MDQKSVAVCSVTLEGEWLTEQAAGLQIQLAAKLAELPSRPPGAGQAEIDLGGITDIDACGCQLLALFLEGLRRRDFAPRLSRVPGQIGETIAELGFSEAVALRGKSGEETA